MADLKYLAENIRLHRKKQGLTQSELAEKMNVSFQAVSGWETGSTVPDIVNFCRLTSVLKVTADALLSSNLAEGQHMIGIDGGGTKTEFVLFSADGSVKKKIKLGASNPDTQGLEKACDILRQGMEACLETSLQIRGVFAGFAGSSQDKISAYFQDRFPKIPFFIDSDAVNTLAASQCDMGFICGTGSIILVRNKNENHFFGGWGFEFGDPGSACNLGREAMRAALAMEEGIGEPTLIRNLLCEKLDVLPEKRIYDKLDEISQKGIPYIASLSTALLSAAKMGDAVALRILNHEISELMKAVNAAKNRFRTTGKIAAAGGIIEHNADLIIPLLHAYAERGTEFFFSDLPPVYGACVECCNRLKLKIPEAFHTKFKETYSQSEEKNYG